MSAIGLLFFSVEYYTPYCVCKHVHRYFIKKYHSPALDACLWAHACIQSMHLCFYVSACMLLASSLASSSTSFCKHPLFQSPLLNVNICQSFTFISSSLPCPLIPSFLSLPPLSPFSFPAHPIWSLTLHSCSSFNEDLSPSHACAYTHYSDTSHTQLPLMRLCVQRAYKLERYKAPNIVYMQAKCVCFSAFYFILG